MDPLTTTLVVLTAVAVLLSVAFAVVRLRAGGHAGRITLPGARPSLASLAEGLGLRMVGAGATGAVDDHPVSIALADRPNARGRLVPFTVVRVQTGVPDLHLARERRTTGTGGDVTTGDPAFDRLVWVDGPAARVSALLDPRTRALLQELVGEATHHEGRWEWAHEGVVTDHQSLRARIDAMVAVTRRWLALDTPTALLERALTDPVDGVRERAAERLVSWWEHNPSDLTAEGAELLASTHLFRGPAVRLARLRGPAGREVLRSFATGEGELAIEAALGLAELREPDAEDLLLGHLKTRDTRVIAALGEVGGARAVAELETMLRESAGWGSQPEPLQRALEHLRTRQPAAPAS